MSVKKPLQSDPPPISLINLDPAAAARSLDAAIAEKNDEKDWLSEKIMVQFYNIEEPGHDGFFQYGPCTNPKTIELKHGEVKELTRADVRFIESRQIPIWEYHPDVSTGKRVKKQIGWKPRYQCRQVNARSGIR